MMPVAPFTGAWIEMLKKALHTMRTFVAPFTGAWIEMTVGLLDETYHDGRSLHGSVD